MNSRRQLLTGLLLAIATAPASADEIPTIAITLSNFAFAPDQIRLRAHAPVRLRLVNAASGGHNFSAPDFFASCTYPGGAAPPNGKIELPAGTSVDLVLVPGTAGSYKLECTHFLHSLFGMTGRIIVE